MWQIVLIARHYGLSRQLGCINTMLTLKYYQRHSKLWSFRNLTVMWRHRDVISSKDFPLEVLVFVDYGYFWNFQNLFSKVYFWNIWQTVTSSVLDICLFFLRSEIFRRFLTIFEIYFCTSIFEIFGKVERLNIFRLPTEMWRHFIKIDSNIQFRLETAIFVDFDFFLKF